MVSPDTGNTERDDLKRTRPNLGRWHPKSHYRIPCVLATAIIPSTATFSLSLNARGTCAKSVWSSLMRSICSDRCPYMKHRWMMCLELFFLMCLLFVCFFFFVPINIGIMMHLRYMRYYIDGSIPTTTLLLVKGRGVDQCGG